MGTEPAGNLEATIAFRRELRELNGFDRDWFRLMATATATTLSEGRASVVTTNVPEISRLLQAASSTSRRKHRDYRAR
jgi:hypothetical protein